MGPLLGAQQVHIRAERRTLGISRTHSRFDPGCAPRHQPTLWCFMRMCARGRRINFSKLFAVAVAGRSLL